MTAEELAAVARAALRAHLEGAPFEPPTGGETAPLFVTLRGPEGLRGSIGTTAPDLPLPALAARLAVLAATDDPRFVPVEAGELGWLEVSVAVLEPPRPVRAPADVDPATDAVSVRSGIQSAILLPDVAMGRGWDAPTLLGYLCHKAGLPREAWTRADAVVEARRAVIGASPAPDTHKGHPSPLGRGGSG